MLLKFMETAEIRRLRARVLVLELDRDRAWEANRHLYAQRDALCARVAELELERSGLEARLSARQKDKPE